MSRDRTPARPGTPRPPRRSEAARALETRLRERRSGARGAFAQPLRYDESGFPVVTQPPAFSERVRRILFG